MPIGFQSDGIQLSPFYFFNEEKKVFYDESGQASPFWEVGHLYDEGYEFKQAEEEELFALFNPATGEFHPFYNDFFTQIPFRKMVAY